MVLFWKLRSSQAKCCTRPREGARVTVFRVILKSNVWFRGGMGANSGEKERSRIRIL